MGRAAFLGVVVTCVAMAGCGSDDASSSPGGSGGSAATAGSGGSGATGGGSGGVAGAGNAAGSGGNAGTAGLSEFYLDVVKPTEGQVHLQTGQPPLAKVAFEVLAGPGIAKVEYVIETGFSLGETTQAPNFPLVYDYQYTGNRWADAIGYDANGAQVATDKVNFVVQGPPASTCMEQLDQLGVQYTKTSAKGVVDAVKLAGPLNGVLFAKTDTDTPSADPMGCEFVLRLWKFADVLKAHGFNKVGTLGSYCYRCCCAWSTENYCRGPNDPEPDCSKPPYSGYSNHSWGRAMDIRWLYKSTGEKYDINNPAHWVEWTGSSSETCTTAKAAQTGISKQLYDLVCDQMSKQVFGICLTPNYNSAHRNHWHCDIGQSGTPSGYKVLSSELPAVDQGEHADQCGGGDH